MIRADLITRFGISAPQAATDFKLYRELQPGVIVYDESAKAYVRFEK